MDNKLFKIMNDLNNAVEKDLGQNISDRLEQVLNLYLEDLEKTYVSALNDKDIYKTMKELVN